MSLLDIAETIRKGMKVPLDSTPAEKAGEPATLWDALRAHCDARYAGFERVDAQDTGMGADWAKTDRGSADYEVLTISIRPLMG